METTPEYPQSRNEKWLNTIAGGIYEVEPEEPQSRIEKWLAYIAEHGGGEKAKAITITLPADGWTNDTQSAQAPGVTETNIVIVDADNPDVQCIQQAQDTLVFSASVTPETDVTVKVVII